MTAYFTAIREWDKGQWEAELHQTSIFVITAQIFLNVLRHGYFHLQDFSVRTWGFFSRGGAINFFLILLQKRINLFTI
jgi:hypothetical protein